MCATNTASTLPVVVAHTYKSCIWIGHRECFKYFETLEMERAIRLSNITSDLRFRNHNLSLIVTKFGNVTYSCSSGSVNHPKRLTQEEEMNKYQPRR